MWTLLNLPAWRRFTSDSKFPMIVRSVLSKSWETMRLKRSLSAGSWFDGATESHEPRSKARRRGLPRRLSSESTSLFQVINKSDMYG